MDETILREVKKILDTETPDLKNQWTQLEYIIQTSDINAIEIFKWIFVEYIGYTEQRGRAGVEFIRCDPNEGWAELVRLAYSHDSNDRDTALYVLGELDDPRVREIAIHLLEDEWPYLQLEAVDILKTHDPQSVLPVLRRLQMHEHEWVRKMASKVLGELGAT